MLQAENAVILPLPAAERLGVEVGETILIKLETLTGQHNVGELVVAAFVEDQEQFGLSAAYVIGLILTASWAWAHTNTRC